MNAVHIKTKGFYCKACPKVVEKAIGAMPGVIKVTSVHSMGLTSVMYHEDKVDSADLCARIRDAGFGAEVYGAAHQGAPQHTDDSES